MKKILRRFCAGIMAVVMLVCLFPVSALALSVQEKEDLFRIDSLLSDGGYDENLEWLLDSNNFIYHKQAQIKDQDFWYCVLNAFDVNPIKIAKAFANDDFSSLWSLNGEYKESMKAVILSLAVNNNSQKTTEILKKEKVEHMYEYVIAAKKYASSTAKYSSLCDSFVESSLYQICESYIDGGQKQIEQQVAMRFGDDGQLCEEMFGEFVSSSDYISFIKAGFEYIDYSSELLEIAKYSYDALAELETYCHQDQQYIDFLRYLYQHSDSYDIVAASGELLTKFTSEYDTNYQEAINDIYAKVCESAGEYALEEVVELITNKLGISSILSGINWGISAAKLVSNYFFNTSEMIDIIVSIRAYDELSEYIGTIVKEKSATYTNYFGSNEGKATLASELIYYIELLWQIRRNGENAFFRFRNVLYEAQVTSFAFTFGHAADDLSSLNQWYGDTMSRFATIYGSLFSEIDSTLFDGLYEYPIQPDKFEIIDKKLIKYNGGDYNIYVPSEVVTIGSGAFTGINIGTVSFEGEIIESNAFSNCSRFYSLYLTKSITTIEDNAFVNCPNLTIYGYRGTYAETYAMDNGIPFEAWDINWDAEDIYNDFVIENDVLVDYVGDGGDVHIPYGVTRIGDSAFYNCDSLISVMIPDSVIEIDRHAFQDCNNLQSVVIPDSVTTICYRAFYGCGSLASVVIPDSVKEIEFAAFEECDNLYEMTLPFVGGSATENGFLGYLFGDDSLDPENSSYIPKSLKTVAISDICKTISNGAFYNCDGLSSIVIGNGVTMIGDDAFGGCKNLSSVYIEDIVRWCGIEFGNVDSNPLYHAGNLYLDGCLVTNLVVPNGVTSISRYAFAGCTSLINVTIPESVTEIGRNSFNGCESIREITLPFIGEGTEEDSETNFGFIFGGAWGDDNSAVPTSIKEVVITKTTKIGKYAFAYCPSIEKITISDGVTDIGDMAFEGCSALAEISIPKGVASIGDCAFQDCVSLTDISIPSSVTSIGYSAFRQCAALTKIIIPDSVQTLGSYAFYWCSSLKNVDISRNITEICDSTFYYCKNLESVTIPNGVITIGEYAFTGCASLTGITIPESVISIERKAFDGCGLLTELVIPSSVTNIGDSAFAFCSSLNTLIISDGVVNIGESAFYGDREISSIYIPASVTYIGEAAFGGCSGLESVDVSVNNTHYQSKQNCLIEVVSKTLIAGCDNSVIPADGSVTVIGPAAFFGCSFSSFDIPDGVLQIGNSAFERCDSLEWIAIPNSVTMIGERAFFGCWSLSNLFIPEKVESIGRQAFMDLVSLESIIVSANNAHYQSKQNCLIEVASKTLIAGCDNSVIPTDGSITVIGEYAFYSCSFTDFVIPGCITTIGKYVFEWCNLENIYIPDSVVEIGYGAFNYSRVGKCYYCGTEEQWTSIKLGESNDPLISADISFEAHNGQWIIIKEPTCVTEGEKVLSCVVCQKDKKLSIVPNGHNPSKNWTIDIVPTCTTVGSKSRHCLTCDAKTDVTELTAAHTYQKVIIQPTCNKNGSITFQCAFCADTYEEILPAAHAWSTVWTVDVEETCTTVGSKSHHCLSCEEKTDVTEIPAAHKWSDEWTVDIEPTETSEGSQSRHCTRCDAKTDVTAIPMLSTESPATDFEYSIRNGEVRITGYVGTSGRMNIPTYIEGCPVTTIAAFAFSGNATITEATIPYTVSNIEYYAFNNCSELLEVNLGNGITEISQSAFSNCSSLTIVNLPEVITTIGDSAFYNCTALTEINIPHMTSTIGGDAFYGTPWFETLTGDCVIMGDGILMKYQNEFGDDIQIPEGVRLVYGDFTGGAFEESYVGTVYIPSTLCSWNQASIGIDAQSFVVDESNSYLCVVDDVLYSLDMTRLKAVPSRKTGTITLPETVRYIEDSAFESSRLDEAVLNEGLLEIGADAFYFADVKVNIPNTVIAIGENAFCYNKALTEVTIPSGVQKIEGWTFSGCSYLEKIALPENLAQIDTYAFSGCNALSTVVYCGKAEQWEKVKVGSSGNAAFTAAKVICLGDFKFSGASLSLQHNLAINYKVDKALFESVGYTNPYVVFELNGVKTKVSSYTISGDRYIFTFRNIAPNQMNDTIQATLYATYDGVEYASATREYSVAEYCYSMLDLYAADQYAELRTLLVDLLNYGAASQTYTNYRTDALVNASLTDAQLQWGTSEEPALDTVLDTTYKTVENPTAKWKGAGLHLQDSVSMRLRFTAESIDGLSVKIESGTNTWTIASDKFLKEDGVYYVYFTGLDAGQMRQSVYLTIYDGDTPVSNTVCYSIGSYAYEKQNSTIAGLPELVKAMMKYGDSAYAYVH